MALYSLNVLTADVPLRIYSLTVLNVITLHLT